MILSCYYRLTDIYVPVFQKMQACVKYPKPPMIDQDYVVVLPCLQVGLCRPPAIHVVSDTSMPSSTTSVYMLMTTMVSITIYNQLIEVMRQGSALKILVGAVTKGRIYRFKAKRKMKMLHLKSPHHCHSPVSGIWPITL
ncbi:hypothetical protein GJ744_008476 [Endocarpon pusillum]|uniref:Uncharacterized protein n=1 Tax=Endocarpon pusillum TaxID=364733 RepID=A0A8H7E6W6_9EURO|nr:hypothetical protein GJ744_008476 [Endocarpon pusillum]